MKTLNGEIHAGYGNVRRQTLNAWRDMYQKALGSYLDYMKARVIGGQNQTLVMDRAVVGFMRSMVGSVSIVGSKRQVLSKTEHQNARTSTGFSQKKGYGEITWVHTSERISTSSLFLINKKPASRAS